MNLSVCFIVTLYLYLTLETDTDSADFLILPSGLHDAKAIIVCLNRNP